MKLRTALYDGHTELATIDDLGAVTLGTPVFPTGNAGEVVFVDGSNHAATSEDFTFDAATKTLTTETVAAGFVRTPTLWSGALDTMSAPMGLIALSVDGSTITASAGDQNLGPTPGFTLDANAGQVAITAGANFFKFNADDSFDWEMSSGSGFFGFAGDSDGNAMIDNSDVSIQWMRTNNVLGAPTFVSPAITLGAKDGFNNTARYLWYTGTGIADEMMLAPVNGITVDLGDIANLSLFRTGYFGTSVVVGTLTLTDSGITGTLVLPTSDPGGGGIWNKAGVVTIGP